MCQCDWSLKALSQSQKFGTWLVFGKEPISQAPYEKLQINGNWPSLSRPAAMCQVFLITYLWNAASQSPFTTISNRRSNGFFSGWCSLTWESTMHLESQITWKMNFFGAASLSEAFFQGCIPRDLRLRKKRSSFQKTAFSFQIHVVTQFCKTYQISVKEILCIQVNHAFNVPYTDSFLEEAKMWKQL